MAVIYTRTNYNSSTYSMSTSSFSALQFSCCILYCKIVLSWYINCDQTQLLKKHLVHSLKL